MPFDGTNAPFQGPLTVTGAQTHRECSGLSTRLGSDPELRTRAKMEMEGGQIPTPVGSGASQRRRAVSASQRRICATRPH